MILHFNLEIILEFEKHHMRRSRLISADNSNFKVYIAGENSLNISYFNDESISNKVLTVSDLQGRIIFEKVFPYSQLNEIYDNIDISLWAKGVYFCRMLDGDIVNVYKIIKR